MPALSPPLCADCQTNPSNLEIRKRHLCHDCFTRYVSSKVLKRMESYRARNLVGDHRRKLLLPVSGGPCSLALLQILDAQLKRQIEKQGRSAYDLLVIHVRSAGRMGDEEVREWYERMGICFAKHNFSPVLVLSDVFDLDDRIETDLRELGLVRGEDEKNQALLVRLLSCARTATARADLEELLLQRLLVRVALKEGCESMLWGHSDSRLAAKALADVAKGRGGSIPSGLADGPSPFDVNFNHPMRDLFRSEVGSYLGCLQPDMTEYYLTEDTRATQSVSIRNMSIDNLLTGYINSQGEKYPSIMANVVRTTGKLQVPSTTDKHCKLCCMPVTTNTEPSGLCYGCERMKQDIKI